MIPFDFELQKRIFKLHMKHKGLSSTTLRYLFLLLPLIALNHLLHNFFFLLDEILFPSYRKISAENTIFIVGPPRCGTSLLLDLLNHSDEITSMKLWELHHAPSICQKRLYLLMGKIDRFFGSPLYRGYKAINQKVLGEFNKIHETSLFHFEEDAMLFYHSANTPFYLFIFPFRELKTPFLDFDHTATAAYKAKYFNYYKNCIRKHLYVYGKDKIYLSKNPLFSAYVRTLKNNFKNARFIFMTRTPYKVAPSAVSLSTHFKGYTSYVSEEDIKNALLKILQMQYTYPCEVLDFEDIGHNALIRFEDLVSDTKATVERLIDRFGLNCPDELRRILSERSKKEKKHVSQNLYSLDKYNISQAEFDEHFKEVLTRFGYEEDAVA